MGDPKGMLQTGDRAPDFVLRDAATNEHALNAQASPLTLAIFFKTSCSTCQYAWKYYERLHRAYANSGLRVLGISQHDAEKTETFRTQHGATFPHLLDDAFVVSRVYDPAIVPTGFLIDSHGVIVETFTSWNRRGLNEFSDRVSERLGVPSQIIVTPSDNAVENKLG